MRPEQEKILQNPGFDIEKVRRDFSYLEDPNPVIYLDNAATTQRPRPVLERLEKFYSDENANPLRGNHRLSLRATEAYEEARRATAEFIHAAEPEEVIFTRNTTEGLNLVAYLYALYRLQPGDEVLITRLEHHSNEVNWQFACRQSGATLRYLELGDDYQLNMEEAKEKINEKTKVFAFSAASNVIATLTPVKELVQMAHAVGAVVVVDGAQLAPHAPVDVQDLDCDFFAFSGHKMGAPFGIGALYGKRALLEALPPFLYGGEMIEYVEDTCSTYAPLPYKFEAGTMNVGGAVGLHAAIDYVQSIGIDKIGAYEQALAAYLAEELEKKGDVEIYRPLYHEAGTMVSFNIKDVHPHDVSTIMDAHDVAIRSGHHCTQPLHRGLGVGSSCRASVAFYNTKEEVDLFLQAVDEVRSVMGLNPKEA